MDAPVAEEPIVAPAPEAGSADPFALDEAKFASLSPEQRAALDPVLDEWKTRAKSEIEKTGKTYEEKYKPLEEKAQALDHLVKDQRFVAWWQNLQQAAVNQNPAAQQAVSQAKPQDFASPQEWQQAILDASAGDSAGLTKIQARMFAAMATPVVQQLRQGQEELRTTLEMRDLFERHADAKELDLIGRNPSDANDKSISLLEMALNWSSDNGKTLEDGYAMAKKWADSLRVGAKQEAMGMVQEKKTSTTSGPSTNQGGTAVVEVADSDELMQKNMEYLAAGQKPPRFVIRPPGAPKESHWAQRT
jgi:hypothetical protein